MLLHNIYYTHIHTGTTTTNVRARHLHNKGANAITTWIDLQGIERCDADFSRDKQSVSESQSISHRRLSIGTVTVTSSPSGAHVSPSVGRISPQLISTGSRLAAQMVDTTCQTYLPFSNVENDSFIKLLQTAWNCGVEYGVPASPRDIKKIIGTRKTLSARIKGRYNEMKDVFVKAIIKPALDEPYPPLGITTDLWTNRRGQSFIGITVSYWDPSDPSQIRRMNVSCRNWMKSINIIAATEEKIHSKLILSYANDNNDDANDNNDNNDNNNNTNTQKKRKKQKRKRSSLWKRQEDSDVDPEAEEEQEEKKGYNADEETGVSDYAQMIDDGLDASHARFMEYIGSGETYMKNALNISNVLVDVLSDFGITYTLNANIEAAKNKSSVPAPIIHPDPATLEVEEKRDSDDEVTIGITRTSAGFVHTQQTQTPQTTHTQTQSTQLQQQTPQTPHTQSTQLQQQQQQQQQQQEQQQEQQEEEEEPQLVTGDVFDDMMTIESIQRVIASTRTEESAAQKSMTPAEEQDDDADVMMEEESMYSNTREIPITTDMGANIQKAIKMIDCDGVQCVNHRIATS